MKWIFFLKNENKKKYFYKIKKFLYKEYYLGKIIYPPKKYIFNALKFTSFDKIKIVILGQDPYVKNNQADGLAFSVSKNVDIPPSLNNIYKEIKSNFTNFNIPKNGCLIKWAKQGVLLLNTILTVEKNKKLSHKNIGWEIFTNKIIKLINMYKSKIVFLLWGLQAKKKAYLINPKKNLILTSSHPSPLSANYGFFGCKHFLISNKFLIKNNIKEIIW
ncbi:Uracil-DNA glycosylase [Candidatus Annandia adelgestsuga]|uniref:Uracil-DNA glycosylase n=2 Tax=Candidatus Annandia adelgestsuga TaxID=1302411 RepID=A0A3Q9CLH1_9ENTR|nr:uracil-DNA glycosylase [Candidatus Annandia adelgestsuga]AZP36336.1 Uracil-DNA glycosylase [Candidatus Annandia adelgestsuga]